jgi:hypothetical protein
MPGTMLDARRQRSPAMLAATLLRLPLQLPLIIGAWRVFRLQPAQRQRALS